jgi:hypothetical protein
MSWNLSRSSLCISIAILPRSHVPLAGAGHVCAARFSADAGAAGYVGDAI